jgi:hypothetical protein
MMVLPFLSWRWLESNVPEAKSIGSRAPNSHQQNFGHSLEESFL